jgi:hypothetical protein
MAGTPQNKMHTMEKNADQVKMHARHQQICQDEKNYQTHVLSKGKQRQE